VVLLQCADPLACTDFTVCRPGGIYCFCSMPVCKHVGLHCVYSMQTCFYSMWTWACTVFTVHKPVGCTGFTVCKLGPVLVLQYINLSGCTDFTVHTPVGYTFYSMQTYLYSMQTWWPVLLLQYTNLPACTNFVIHCEFSTCQITPVWCCYDL